MRWIQGSNKALEKSGTSIKEVEKSKIYERREEWRNLVKDSPADRLYSNKRRSEKVTQSNTDL